MNKSFIVLGGSGFLGKQIINELITRGYTNIASVSRSQSKIKGVINIPIDILNDKTLDRAVKPYEVIINCIGQITSPIIGCLVLNSLGSHIISEVAGKQNKRLVHLSTVGVYGTCNFADEDTVMNPETPYATSKAMAELILRNRISDNKLVIIRLSNVYGIHTKGIFSYLHKSYISDKLVHFNNNGSPCRYYMHVNDCAYNIVELITNIKKGGIYNLKGNEKYTIKEIINSIEAEKKIKFKVIFGETNPVENIIELSDMRIRNIIDPRFKHSMKQFIKSYF